jgi:hypothetical protein
MISGCTGSYSGFSRPFADDEKPPGERTSQSPIDRARIELGREDEDLAGDAAVDMHLVVHLAVLLAEMRTGGNTPGIAAEASMILIRSQSEA